MSQSSGGGDMKFIGIVIGVALVAIVGFVLLSKGSPPANPTTRTGTLNIGDAAPEFKLPSTTGGEVSLSQYDNQPVLLYFNEGVGCQACWQQLVLFEKDSKLSALNVPIVTIAPDELSDWNPILRSSPIKSPILADKGNNVSESYGMLNMKSSMHAGVKPGHTFALLDKAHKVAWIGDYPQMNISSDQMVSTMKEKLSL